jgi:peroxiredoxin family protein
LETAQHAIGAHIIANAEKDGGQALNTTTTLFGLNQLKKQYSKKTVLTPSEILDKTIKPHITYMKNLKEREQRELAEIRRNIQNTPTPTVSNGEFNLLTNPNMPKI